MRKDFWFSRVPRDDGLVRHDTAEAARLAAKALWGPRCCSGGWVFVAGSQKP